jgi:hypothetical protein
MVASSEASGNRRAGRRWARRGARREAGEGIKGRGSATRVRAARIRRRGCQAARVSGGARSGRRGSIGLGAPVRFDELFGRINATPAAGPDGQMHLQLGDGPDATVDDFADLPVGYGVTNADVHGVPQLPISTRERLLRSERKCECFLLGAGRRWPSAQPGRPGLNMLSGGPIGTAALPHATSDATASGSSFARLPSRCVKRRRTPCRKAKTSVE